MKRLTRLEEISESFEGVEKCFAVQAGREIRIMVKPDQIDDATSILLARDIAKKIEAEMEYPGQIKVVILDILIRTAIEEFLQFIGTKAEK